MCTYVRVCGCGGSYSDQQGSARKTKQAEGEEATAQVKSTAKRRQTNEIKSKVISCGRKKNDSLDPNCTPTPAPPPTQALAHTDTRRRLSHTKGKQMARSVVHLPLLRTREREIGREQQRQKEPH